MAFTLQNDSGTVDDANAYIDTAFFKDYHKDRNNDFSGGNGDIQKAIVRATDYLDQRFRFIGERPNVRQRTQWPRIDAEDIDDNLRSGIPFEVKEATAEYALQALTAVLNPEPDRDTTGRSVQSKREKVGPIEEELAFADGAAWEPRIIPAADMKLTMSGLVIEGTMLRRA